VQLFTSDNQDKSNKKKIEKKNSTALEVKSGVTDTNVTAISELELCCFSESVPKQHQVAPPSPSDHEILPKGTKVQCDRVDREGVVYASRRKEFKKPNGTTEVVVQYYIEFGNEDYRWLDWDLVGIM
jgi:hypothetical protein